MIICAISDVHCKWKNLIIPKCDILISAGDYSFKGEHWVVEDFHKWLSKQPAKHVISVQGNHELWVEKNFLEAKRIAQEACPNIHFIDVGLIEIEGKKIYCSAVTPFFHNWAWNKHPDELHEHWELIPEDTNILITHGPPYGICDELLNPAMESYNPKRHLGCKSLADRVKIIKPEVHIFGHIHCGYGQKHLDCTSYYNVAINDEMYCPTNPVTIIEI